MQDVAEYACVALLNDTHFPTAIVLVTSNHAVLDAWLVADVCATILASLIARNVKLGAQVCLAPVDAADVGEQMQAFGALDARSRRVWRS